MDSAQGQVQHLKYTATFPLLLNVGNRPTYFMSLKDAAGLVKMYAFVDVQQYQIVGTGTSVESARTDYLTKLQAEGELIPETPTLPEESITEISGTVTGLATAVVDGNSMYYIRLQDAEGKNHTFVAPISLSAELPFLAEGDGIRVSVSESGALTELETLSVPVP